MISDKLKHIYLLSLLLIYAHGVEEIINGFQYSDSFMVYGANLFNTTPEIFYLIFHLIWWFSLPILFLLFNKSRLGLFLMTLYGFVFFIELHHPIKGLLIGSYYPGMITAMLYPIFGIFYWKQVIKEWKLTKK
ncbi:HXXEE domain-containing protein [Candidatus Daviesbacteria bacterium]|nr:HXXEE domain-containing protein [Candidatus Daviesbacteria bacterium]